jgi:hypothetical protein
MQAKCKCGPKKILSVVAPSKDGYFQIYATYMLHFYPYKHIATNRFASSQANFYHVSMFLALRRSGTNAAYVVCIHIDLRTHFETKRIRIFSFTLGFTKLPLPTCKFIECCHPNWYVGKTDLYTRRSKEHVTFN